MMESSEDMKNPLEPSEPLKESSHLSNGDRPQETDQPVLPDDSAMAKAEKAEWARSRSRSPAKRKREENEEDANMEDPEAAPPRKKGTAPIREEYLIKQEESTKEGEPDARASNQDRRKKQKGQNTNRSFGIARDAIQLCMSRASEPEYSPKDCSFGDNCKYEHDLRKYLKDGKREDLKTFDNCPVWEARGRCDVGWRCRFVMSHAEERELPDGRKELVLLEDPERVDINRSENPDGEETGVVNIVNPQDRIDLQRRKTQLIRAEQYTKYLDDLTRRESGGGKGGKNRDNKENRGEVSEQESKDGDDAEKREAKLDHRAQHVEPPFRPSEKRRLYFGPETPVLAPLTTQGNLPFRRLAVSLGAQVTWSEMAMSLPIIQGERSEFALMKAHKSELESPVYKPSKDSTIVEGYDNSRDLRFGAQICANKHWQALKATEVLSSMCPHLRAIDLNCGCPIDLVYRQGAGSALLDSPSKLEKILRGMNAVSGEIPIQVKIRMGTKDNKPTAYKLVDRLAFGGADSTSLDLGPAGIAAITLHGRSRQQRYTKRADWSYIADCASLIRDYNKKRDSVTDTAREPDGRDTDPSQKLYFIGNGDCYSHLDYFQHIEEAKVDSVMIARGALIKPWIFEEISTGQYLDKSSSERLRYIEQFARFGLETWGSDEMGVSTTRRFLLEWLSFTHRYVPIGLLEYLPPSLNDRPPAYRGRDELETLLASGSVNDWVKISEMFLGPTPKGFRFDPKHKSNASSTENDYTAEG